MTLVCSSLPPTCVDVDAQGEPGYRSERANPQPTHSHVRVLDLVRVRFAVVVVQCLERREGRRGGLRKENRGWGGEGREQDGLAKMVFGASPLL